MSPLCSGSTSASRSSVEHRSRRNRQNITTLRSLMNTPSKLLLFWRLCYVIRKTPLSFIRRSLLLFLFRALSPPNLGTSFPFQEHNMSLRFSGHERAVQLFPNIIPTNLHSRSRFHPLLLGSLQAFTTNAHPLL